MDTTQQLINVSCEVAQLTWDTLDQLCLTILSCDLNSGNETCLSTHALKHHLLLYDKP